MFLPFAVSVLFKNFTNAPLYYFSLKNTQKFPISGKNGFKYPVILRAKKGRLAHAKTTLKPCKTGYAVGFRDGWLFANALKWVFAHAKLDFCARENLF